MTTDLTTKLYLSAMEALERGPAPRHYAPAPAADDPHIAAFKRQCENDAELRRVMGLPRVTQPNPADTCSCGAEAEHTEYRNGHEIGVCADCK